MRPTPSRHEIHDVQDRVLACLLGIAPDLEKQSLEVIQDVPGLASLREVIRDLSAKVLVGPRRRHGFPEPLERRAADAHGADAPLRSRKGPRDGPPEDARVTKRGCHTPRSAKAT